MRNYVYKYIYFHQNKSNVTITARKDVRFVINHDVPKFLPQSPLICGKENQNHQINV